MISINLATFIGLVFVLFIPNATIVLLKSGSKWSTIYSIYKRMLSSLKHSLTWYEDDPFDKDSKSHNSLKSVRFGHICAIKLMNKKYEKEGSLWGNQLEMAIALWLNFGLLCELLTNITFIA